MFCSCSRSVLIGDTDFQNSPISATGRFDLVDCKASIGHFHGIDGQHVVRSNKDSIQKDISMKKLHSSALLIVMIALWSGGTQLQYARAETPAIGSQVTFLYYKDLVPPARFYGEVLGFPEAFDGGWVKMYRISETSYVGLVDESKGYLKTASDKPVMLSIETAQVAEWYERVKANGPEFLETHLKPADEGLANGFLMRDPAGYAVEIFKWNEGYGFNP